MDHARPTYPPLRLSRPAAAPRLSFITGFEGTQMFGHATDVLDTTEHVHRFRDDLGLLARDGLRSLRACIPWHKIEREPGRYDWAWTGSYLGHIRALGLNPIVDPLHHTSFPQWLEHGFANPSFPETYERFTVAFAKRYPWVTDYTIINEPLATAILCGFTGDWYPHWEGRAGIVPIVLGMARAIARITPRLAELVPGLRIVHVDTCERHHALDAPSAVHADFANELRFVVLDLILGRMDRNHPLWTTMRRHGMSADDAAWFQGNPARVDVLGLDYYAHSEMGWNVQGRSEHFEPLGFRRAAIEYVDRYALPVMLSETNLRGRIEDRISWLRYMVGECEALAAELPARGSLLREFCWYPFIDSTDWDSLVRKPRRAIDPQGIYWLSERFDRVGSEMSRLYAALARGEVTAADLPAYRFEDPVLDGRGVRKFLPQMASWRWLEGEPSGWRRTG